MLTQTLAKTDQRIFIHSIFERSFVDLKCYIRALLLSVLIRLKSCSESLAAVHVFVGTSL